MSPWGCQLSGHGFSPALSTSLDLRRRGIKASASSTRHTFSQRSHHGKASEFPGNPSGAADLRQPLRGCNKESGPQRKVLLEPLISDHVPTSRRNECPQWGELPPLCGIMVGRTPLCWPRLLTGTIWNSLLLSEIIIIINKQTREHRHRISPSVPSYHIFLQLNKNCQAEAEAKADCVQVEFRRDGTFQSGHCETPKLAEPLFLPAENFCG